MSNVASETKKGLKTILTPLTGLQNKFGDEGVEGMMSMRQEEGMPEVAPPIEMPDPIAEAAQNKRASIVEQKKRRGRASTIMTQNTGV
jgi:hypothetical protein